MHGVFVAIGSGILPVNFILALLHRLLLRCKSLPPQIEQSELGCGARSFRFPTNPLAICSVGGNVFLAGSLAQCFASEVTPVTHSDPPAVGCGGRSSLYSVNVLVITRSHSQTGLKTRKKHVFAASAPLCSPAKAQGDLKRETESVCLFLRPSSVINTTIDGDWNR